MSIEITPRNKSGRKQKKNGRLAPDLSWKRLRSLLKDDNWKANFERANLNPNVATAIGLLYIRGFVQPRHCEAARIYAEICGRYDRFHKDTKLPRTAGSPSYEYGLRSRDDELERRVVDGSIKAYEKEAKRAKRAHAKLMGCVPTENARMAMDEVCIYDRYPPSEMIPDVVNQLERIIKVFQHRFEKSHADGKIKAWQAPAPAAVRVGEDGGG